MATPMRVVPVELHARQANNIAALARAVRALGATLARTTAVTAGDAADDAALARLELDAAEIAGDDGVCVATAALVDVAVRNHDYFCATVEKGGANGPPEFSSEVLGNWASNVANDRLRDYRAQLDQLRAEHVRLCGGMEALQEHARKQDALNDRQKSELQSLRITVDRVQELSTTHDYEMKVLRESVDMLHCEFGKAKEESFEKAKSARDETYADVEALRVDVFALRDHALGDVEVLRSAVKSCEESLNAAVDEARGAAEKSIAAATKDISDRFTWTIKELKDIGLLDKVASQLQKAEDLHSSVKVAMDQMNSRWCDAVQSMHQSSRETAAGCLVDMRAEKEDLHSKIQTKLEAMEKLEREREDGIIALRRYLRDVVADAGEESKKREESLRQDVTLKLADSSKELRELMQQLIEDTNLASKQGLAELKRDAEALVEQSGARAIEAHTLADLEMSTTLQAEISQVRSKMDKLQQEHDSRSVDRDLADRELTTVGINRLTDSLRNLEGKLATSQENIDRTIATLSEQQDKLSEELASKLEACRAHADDAVAKASSVLRKSDEDALAKACEALEKTRSLPSDIEAACTELGATLRQEILGVSSQGTLLEREFSERLLQLGRDTLKIREDVNTNKESAARNRIDIEGLVKEVENGFTEAIERTRALVVEYHQKSQRDNMTHEASFRETNAEFGRRLDALQEVCKMDLAELQGQQVRAEEQFKVHAECLAQRLAGAERQLTETTAIADANRAHGDDLEFLVKEAVTSLRDVEIREYNDVVTRLRHATSSLARGVVRMVEVFGLFPRDTKEPLSKSEDGRLDVIDVLEWELAGCSLAHRVESAWRPQGCKDLIELVQRKAEHAALKATSTAVGRLDAEVTHTRSECHALAIAMPTLVAPSKANSAGGSLQFPALRELPEVSTGVCAGLEAARAARRESENLRSRGLNVEPPPVARSFGGDMPPVPIAQSADVVSAKTASAPWGTERFVVNRSALECSLRDRSGEAYASTQAMRGVRLAKVPQTPRSIGSAG